MMRIFRRDDFMNLPAGVLYSKGKPWYFDGLMRKDETIEVDQGRPIDWLYQDLVNIDMGADSGEWADRLEHMLEYGSSQPMEDGTSRDGCFDEDELFLVFEPADLVRLQAIISDALKIAPTINGELGVKAIGS